MIDIYIIYKNYLHALEIRKQYGDQYGDTDEIINMFEEILKENNYQGLIIRKRKHYYK